LFTKKIVLIKLINSVNSRTALVKSLNLQKYKSVVISFIAWTDLIVSQYFCFNPISTKFRYRQPPI